MSENTPSPAGLPGTFSASSDSPRPDPAKTHDAQAAVQNAADDGASPVTAASEPGAPGAAGAIGDGAATASP
ncbi:gamma-glutamyl-gamma-aminobutyrate hydrolase, partial [Burkholderia cenocepacia]|nr:gamma-glutamyl-gamma-aminobutyrate hydrolase [Burkholderia cenocepacia]